MVGAYEKKGLQRSFRHRVVFSRCVYVCPYQATGVSTGVSLCRGPDRLGVAYSGRTFDLGSVISKQIRMRLWSLHPKYLDAKGLIACWREGLLARKVLLGQTRGYRGHPQLDRFRNTLEPVRFIDTYLGAILAEAVGRGYGFDRAKIGRRLTKETLPLKRGQLAYELKHLVSKLTARDPARIELIPAPRKVLAHPLFVVTQVASNRGNA